MKFILKIFFLTSICLSASLVGAFPVSAQTASRQYTLDSCYVLARDNYPMMKQYGIIQKLGELSVRDALSSYIPQITLGGEAAYYSDVVAFPEKIEALFSQFAGMDFEGLRNDQYKVLLDINQNLWDGGYSGAKKAAAIAEAEVSAMKTATELYGLKSRVTEVYFGILATGAMIEQNDVAAGILKDNRNMLQACVENGVAMESDLDAIDAEILANEQNRIRLVGSRDTYIRLMSLITGRPMDTDTEFLVPEEALYRQEYGENEVKRYELALFDAQEASVAARRKMVNSSVMPSFSLFAQGYYGYPGMNMFDDMLNYKWGFNGVVGIRFRWNISGFFTKKNHLGQLDQSLRTIELQRETFLFNNRLEQAGKSAEIEQMRSIMEQDERIIGLRRSVREASEARLANGTITANDLVRDIAAETKARLDRSLHELEYLQKIYEMKYIVND
ncbi:MAG: TolC family protein [Muribaculum sp.]|uniref:TolC family protein n=1 Tax=Candidatus Merdivivens faecigallinarum TaxID=2840871 RepID=A0A9D9J1J3_9BACT|nr:TolC family protein [Candidatus Merdivivens faecigallinarum]